LCLDVAPAAGLGSGEAAFAMGAVDNVPRSSIAATARRRDLRFIQLIKHLF
jgi:hypothetical protein